MKLTTKKKNVAHKPTSVEKNRSKKIVLCKFYRAFFYILICPFSNLKPSSPITFLILDIEKKSGLFDIRLKQQYQDTTKGFYDGKTFDTVLQKQNAFLGSKVYVGYRKSYGTFPAYDDKYLTNNSGEYRLGASVSLLQNNIPITTYGMKF